MPTATPRIASNPTNPLSVLGSPTVSPPANTLSSEGIMAQALGLGNEQRQTGNALLGAGGQGLDAVMQLLMKLMGGDRTAMMEAAAPEVNSVLTQYDTARKAVSASAPRGGGRNALLAETRYKEAGDITNLLAQTRKDATSTLGTLSTQLVGLGAGEQASAQQGFAQIIQALLGKDIADNQTWAAIAGTAGTAMGSILASYFMKK